MVSFATSPVPLGPVLPDEYTGIEDVARIRRDFDGAGALIDRDADVQINGVYADPGFFRIFGFELSDGDPATALTEPYSLILSRAIADHVS